MRHVGNSICQALILALVGFACPWSARDACAQGPAPREHEVKAAFLFKFLGFVEWPPAAFSGAGAPLVIGVSGAEEVFLDLEQIAAGRAAQGRRVTVKRIRPGESLSDVHMLFVGRRAGGAIPKDPPGLPLLIVSESDGALNQGSAINFVEGDGRVRFEIALDNVGARGLRISSRMLAVASFVRTEKP
jgi:YfiR/HmsC-like